MACFCKCHAKAALSGGTSSLQTGGPGPNDQKVPRVVQPLQ